MSITCFIFTLRGSSTRVGLELELTSCTSLTYANTVVKIKIKHRNIRKDWLASGSHNEGQKNKTQTKKSIQLVGQFQFHTSEWEHNFLNKNRGPPVEGFMFYFCFLFFPSYCCMNVIPVRFCYIFKATLGFFPPVWQVNFRHSSSHVSINLTLASLSPTYKCLLLTCCVSFF